MTRSNNKYFVRHKLILTDKQTKRRKDGDWQTYMLSSKERITIQLICLCLYTYTNNNNICILTKIYKMIVISNFIFQTNMVAPNNFKAEVLSCMFFSNVQYEYLFINATHYSSKNV